MKIAIIGAGISGLSLAKMLRDDHAITVFEKARGVGGRMSTRYADQFEFDHGAQYFKARSQDFQNFLKPFIDEHNLAQWDANIIEIDADNGKNNQIPTDTHPYYVAAPRMNSLCKALLDKENTILQARITSLKKTNNQWTLIDENGNNYKDYDWIISTAPPAQTAELYAGLTDQSKTIENIEMKACLALMLGLNEKLDINWNAARIKNSPISWIAVNSSKPGRPEGTSVVVHANHVWSEAHIDYAADEVRDMLLKEVSKLLDHNFSQAPYQSGHKWRYAICDSSDHAHFIDHDAKLAACGDWCVAGRVEGAFLSASSLYKELAAI